MAWIIFAGNLHSFGWEWNQVKNKKRGNGNLIFFSSADEKLWKLTLLVSEYFPLRLHHKVNS